MTNNSRTEDCRSEAEHQRKRSELRPDNSNFPLAHNHKAARPLIDAFTPKHILHTTDEIPPTRRLQPNQQNAGMRSRSESADIGKIQVLGEQESGLGLRGAPYVQISASGQAFTAGGVYVVPKILQRRRKLQRQILVQLDFHRKSGTAGVGRSSSAEAAAKAIAA